MGHIFLGHGSLTPEGYSYQPGMDTVAVPPGTSLQFFADIGQGLVVTTELLIQWNKLQRPWAPLTSQNVTYNLGLGGFPDEVDGAGKWLAMLASAAGEHEIHIPGTTDDVRDKEMLCAGSAGQCPTDPREQRGHTCDGILGRFSGDLYWIACTSLVLPKPENLTEEDDLTPADVAEMRAVMEAARGNAPKDAVLGASPDNLLAATLRLLDNQDSAIDFHAYFEVLLSDDQRRQVMQNTRVADWIRDNPF